MITIVDYQKAQVRYLEMKDKGFHYILANSKEHGEVIKLITKYQNECKDRERDIELFNKWLSVCDIKHSLIIYFWGFFVKRKYSALMELYLSGIPFYQSFKIADAI